MELNKSQEQALPNLSEREVLEGLKPEQLLDLILTHGSLIANYERTMNLASDVLEGAYGTTVEQELAKRETHNGTKT